MKIKKNTQICICLVLIAVFSWFFASFVLAAQVEVQPGFYDQYQQFLNTLGKPATFPSEPTPEVKNALPYYSPPFSNFLIEFSPSQKNSYLASDTLELKGKITYQSNSKGNFKEIEAACTEAVKDKEKNPCPSPEIHQLPQIYDAGLFVQVWRKDQNSKNGDFLVDQFYVFNKDINLGEQSDFSLSWPIPSGQAAGNYYLALFLNSNKAFDLAGTPLAPLSEAKRFDFEINNPATEAVEIDKNNLKISSTPYKYRAPTPIVENKELNISAPLVNPGGAPKEVTVKYNLYRWSSANPEDLIDTRNETKSIPAGGTVDLAYQFKPQERESVYVIQIIADSNTTKSMALIRFAIKGQNRGIFRFLSLAEDNGKLSPYFCARNAAWSGQFAGKIRLELNGQTWERDGQLKAEENNCFLVNNEAMKTSTTGCSELKGTILDKNGNKLDEKKVSLNCQAPKPGESAPIIGNIFKQNWVAIVIVIVLILSGIGIGIVYIYYRKKSGGDGEPTQTNDINVPKINNPNP